MRWVWYVTRVGEMRNSYKILVEKNIRCSRRRDGNFKLNIGALEYEDVDWIKLAENRVQQRALVNVQQ